MAKAGERDDPLMVAALAAVAVAIVTTDHEAIGHGSACLVLGGRITELTSVYFSCTTDSGWIAAAGPANNLLGGFIAWALLQFLPPGRPRLRFLLLLVVAFSFFWEAGYLLYAAVLDEGDWAIAAHRLLGLGRAWGFGGFALGMALYLVAVRAVSHEARVFAEAGRARGLFTIAWLAGAAASVLATLVYSAHTLMAVRQGALEIGAASLPLLLIPGGLRPGGRAEAALTRSHGWLAACTILYAAFLATLGRGLP